MHDASIFAAGAKKLNQINMGAGRNFIDGWMIICRVPQEQVSFLKLLFGTYLLGPSTHHNTGNIRQLKAEQGERMHSMFQK